MNGPVSIGDIKLTFVSGGRLRIDGGNMFGVVPRLMWEKTSPPDEQNRIELATNCVLVRMPTSLGLIDTGYGGKASPKQRQRHNLDEGVPLARNLASVGVAPDDIDWVMLTHLHFDHAGGVTYLDDEGRLRLMFSRARHVVQRIEWEDATSNLPELAGAYPDDFAPLENAGLLEFVDGETEVVPGVTTRLTGAHTRGHQIVRIDSGGESAVCLADMCPTTAHLRTFWTMAYDQFPLAVRREKPIILNDIVDNNRVALFSHDPHIAAARLARVSDNEWRIVPLESE
jgi:glyoxylase-like metal-dependent hydrolase (beta-lactamase superfamily II)